MSFHKMSLVVYKKCVTQFNHVETGDKLKEHPTK